MCVRRARNRARVGSKGGGGRRKKTRGAQAKINIELGGWSK